MADRFAQALIAFGTVLLAVLVGLGGLGFLAAALYQSLGQIIPAAGAAAIVGVLALLLMIALFFLARAAVAPVAKAAYEGDSTSPDPLAETARSLRPAIRKHAPESAALAFGTGIILAVSPRARRALWSAVLRAVGDPDR